jgi:hypothetical protein
MAELAGANRFCVHELCGFRMSQMLAGLVLQFSALQLCFSMFQDSKKETKRTKREKQLPSLQTTLVGPSTRGHLLNIIYTLCIGGFLVGKKGRETQSLILLI